VTIGASFGGPFARRVFVIHADQGTFAAKVNDNPPPPETARAELEVLGYLATRGYRHAPALMRTNGGSPLAHTGTRSVAMLEFVPGRFDDLTDGKHVRAWAALAGATAALNAHTDYPGHAAQDFVDQVPDQLRQKVRGHRIEKEFLALLERTAPLRYAAQRSLVHGEVNFANSGYRGDGTTVLLDWDGAGQGPTALDYGYPLITQFIDECIPELDRDAAEAYYGAYRDAGGVVDVEMAFRAAILQALFLMWFSNTDSRWARIQWALDREAELCGVIERACTR
jgi:Ser/Thr protein kinase RdoA (MazF antagonist)